MTILFIADTGDKLRCFENPEDCVDCAFRVFDKKRTSKCVVKFYSDAEGLQKQVVDVVDKEAIAEYILQMRIHATFTVAMEDKEQQTTTFVKIRKSYLS